MYLHIFEIIKKKMFTACLQIKRHNIYYCNIGSSIELILTTVYTAG